jgi:hypothetical protein
MKVTMPINRILALGSVLVVTACASQSMRDSDAAFIAQAELVGLSRAQVIACAGKPDSSVTKGDAESLTYSASSGETAMTVGGRGALLENAPRSCKVVFGLRRGYVEGVEYVGARTGGLLTPGEECLPIVRKCTGPR